MILSHWALSALIATSSPAPTVPHDLSYNPSLSIPLTAVGILSYGSLSLFEKDLAPVPAHWSSVNGFDDGARDHLKWGNTNLAVNLSDVAGYGLAPLYALGSSAWISGGQGEWRRFWLDAAIITEAVSWAGTLSKVVQIGIGRERPSAHALSPADRDKLSADRNLSFYSGHTTMAFALASASGTVASLRGYDQAPWVWVGGLSIATATAYLRVAADAHYLTDVLAGALIGSAAGFALPYFLHPREDSSSATLRIVPLASGLQASAEWKW